MKNWYEVYVFAPSVLSCTCSVLLVFNVVKGSYKKYFFHQMSAILAFFDVIQCLGIFLDAPWLDSTCYPASYFFLWGSLCKVLAVTYITATITHVILYMEAPSKKKKVISSMVAVFLALISAIILPVEEVAEILCFDKDPVTFNYDDVSFHKRRMFFVFYAMPISIMFFLIMLSTLYSVYRLRDIEKTGVNKGMLRLLRRLLPLSLVFFIAFTPTAIFFLRGYVTDKEDFNNKVVAIFGQVISGTLYALCYAYFCYADHTYVAAATKRILEIEKETDSNADFRNTFDVRDVAGSRDRNSSIGHFTDCTEIVPKGCVEMEITGENPMISAI